MRVADVLRELGRPIAYYPFLARYLGGVNAAVFFCQIFYWQDKATSELGVHKTVDELESETGLSYEEQRAARTKLRAAGVLIETAKRIEHRTYFRVDEEALEQLLAAGVPVRTSKRVPDSTSEKSISRNGKSPSREMGKVHPVRLENPTPPDGETLSRGKGDSHSVNGTEITAETTAATRASIAVDNSAAAAALEDEKPDPDAERILTDLLISLERERGKDLQIDRSRDRVHVLTWVGKGVTTHRLREAHALAVAARKRDGDDRPTYPGFISTLIDAEAAAAKPAPRPDVSDAAWWESDSGVAAKGLTLHVERPKDEPTPKYLVRVARAAGRGPWIDHVLREAQKVNAKWYQDVVNFLGEALMPTDFYAS